MSEGLFPPTGPDKRMVLEELSRELAMRKNVFPSWVDKGRLTPEVAAHRILCMQEAIRLLEEAP